MKNKANNYVEYINQNFKIVSGNEHSTQLKEFINNIFLLKYKFISEEKTIIEDIKSQNVKVIRNSETNELILLMLIVPSGLKPKYNHANSLFTQGRYKKKQLVSWIKKRIQLQQKFIKYNSENTKIIGFYESGNESCFVLFKNRDILNITSNTIVSLWIPFEYLIYCLKMNRSFTATLKRDKISTDIVVSKSIDNLIDNKSCSEVINCNDLEIIKNSVIDYCIANKKLLLTKTVATISDAIHDDDGFFSKTVKKFFPNCKNVKYKTNLVKNQDGREAEEIAYNFLLTQKNIVTKIFDIEDNYSVLWLNESGEKYRPYDISINENIYIEVKGTWKPEAYFIMSANEFNFYTESLKENKKYFLINIFNCNKNRTEVDIKIFDKFQLKKLDIKPWKYIFNDVQYKGDEVGTTITGYEKEKQNGTK